MVPFTVPGSETVSVNVNWTPGYNGGYDQQFSIHYRKKGSGSDFTEEFVGPSRNNMHTVRQLSPNTEYEFMMQASNRRGNSPTSPLAQVTTSGNKEITFLLLIRTVIKRRGPGISPGYYVCDPRLFLNRKNIHVALKEIATTSRRGIKLLFTRQVQILVISLIKYRISSNKRPPLNKCPPSRQKIKQAPFSNRFEPTTLPVYHAFLYIS